MGYSTLKAALDAVVKTNGRQQITGSNLNGVMTTLLQGVDILDRANPADTSGMDKVVLKKGSTFASQVTAENTIYEIRDSFDLGGSSVPVPAGSILLFEGGTLTNGTLASLGACGFSGSVRFSNVTFSGKWLVDHVSPDYFGAKGDGVTDDTNAVQGAVVAAIALNCIMELNGLYKVTQSVNIASGLTIEGKYSVNIQVPTCGFTFSGQTCLKLNASRNVKLNNIAFVQSDTTANLNAIELTGICSCFTLLGCSFRDVTGYAIYFRSPTYSQMVNITNLSCWHCGGVIGGDGSANPSSQKGLVVTCAFLENINLDDGVNEVSPQNILLDLSGFREYNASHIVLEGTTGNNATGLKISNCHWNIIDGCHIEFYTNTCQVGVEVAQSLYQASGNGFVEIIGVSGPVLLSADYTTLIVKGMTFFAGTKWYSITGTGSRIVSRGMRCATPSFNVFSPDDVGVVSYDDFRLQEVSAPLPVKIQPYMELFKWGANDGDLTAFQNPYFYGQQLTPTASLDVRGIVDSGDIGKVQRYTPNTTDYFPVIAIRFKTGVADKFIGKRITLAMTYRVSTSATQGLNAAAVINAWGSHDGCTFLNARVFDGTLAIAVISLVVKSGTTGFCGNNGSNMDGISTLDIIGVNVVIGDVAIPTPLQL